LFGTKEAYFLVTLPAYCVKMLQSATVSDM